MTQKLPKVFKRKWVAALRSGEFKQGISNLYSKVDNTFCCLGVAENICGTTLQSLHGKTLPFYLRSPKSPNLLRTRWEDKEGKITVVGKLAEFNDKPKSFKWIANYIEKNL